MRSRDLVQATFAKRQCAERRGRDANDGRPILRILLTVIGDYYAGVPVGPDSAWVFLGRLMPMLALLNTRYDPSAIRFALVHPICAKLMHQGLIGHILGRSTRHPTRTDADAHS